MRHYEVMLILDPNLEDKDATGSVAPHLWMGACIRRLRGPARDRTIRIMAIHYKQTHSCC
jgi:hypothetical protein